MNGVPTFPDWSSVLKRRAQLLHQQIAAMQRLVLESGGSEEMLNKVLDIDVDQNKKTRLVNLIMQKRAKWLLSRVDTLFVK